MGTASSPPKSVVQTVTAAGKRVLRSVKLLGAERPAGVPWKCKVRFSDTTLNFYRGALGSNTLSCIIPKQDLHAVLHEVNQPLRLLAFGHVLEIHEWRAIQAELTSCAAVNICNYC